MSRLANELQGLLYTPLDIGVIGFPLVEGQDLEGADLAPLAFRQAGKLTEGHLLRDLQQAEVRVQH